MASDQRVTALPLSALGAGAWARALHLVELGRGLKPDPKARGGDQDGGEEVAGGLVVARGDAAEVLELIEETLDEIALR